jgi:hypothetical protein
MGLVSPAPAESGDPKPTNQNTAREGERRASEDPTNRLARLIAARAIAAAVNPGPKLTLFAACLAVLGAGWWFYREDAGDRGERTISSASAGEVLTEQFMEKQRRRNAELEQELKLLVQEERARAKEFEEQLAARRRLPPVQQPTTSPAAAIDSTNATPVYRPPEK